MTDKNIKHIVGPLDPIENTQFGVELDVNPVTGFVMWGGKDSNGDVTRWLALDKNARVNDLETLGTFLTQSTTYKENVTPVPAIRKTDWNEGENAPQYYSSVSGSTTIIGKSVNIPLAYNDTGSAIPAGTPCRVVGAFTSRPGVEPISSLTYEAEDTLAYPKDAIPIASYGECIWFGAGEGIDTSLFAPDDKLYLSETVGVFTTTPPTDKVFVGRCLVSSSSVGRILFVGVSGGGASHILHPEPEYIDLITGLAAPPHKIGRVSWDDASQCPAFYDEFSGTWVQMTQELLLRACNDTGSEISNGSVVYGAGSDGECLSVGLLDAGTYDRNQVLAVATVGVPTKNLPTETGVGKFTKFGVVRDFPTDHLTEGKKVFASTVPGSTTSVRPEYPATPIVIGYCVKSHATEGVILVDISTDPYDYEFDGCVVENHDYFIVVGTGDDLGKVFLDAEKKGGGDIPVQLKGSRYLLDCTTGAGVGGRARVELTPGADDAPVRNYPYLHLVGSTLTLTNSTVAPSGAFAPLGRIALWSAAKTGTDTTAMNRRTTDAIADEYRGHLAHLNERVRVLGSQWDDGVAPTVTITTNAGVMDSLDVEVIEGDVWQLHKQSFPALQMSVDGAYITNADAGAVSRYEKIFDGGLALQTADGTAIAANQYFNMLIFGAINKETAECKLYYGLPTGTYSTREAAYNDTSRYSHLSADSAISEVLFPIVRVPLRRKAVGGGTLEFINVAPEPEVVDLRGVPMNASASGGAGVSGATLLSQLSDTDIDVPEEGQSLVRLGGFWKNKALSLNDAANVNPNLAREIDVSDGAITGIVDSGKPLDAVSLSQLRRQSMGVGSVLSVIDAAPTLATEVVGNKYLVGAGTGLFADHDDDQAEVIGRRIDPTVLRHGSSLGSGVKSVAYAPDKGIYAAVGTGIFAYSYDGVNYVTSSTTTTELFTKVEYIEDGGVFIACATQPTTHAFARSTDGKNWTLIVGLLKDYKGLAYHKGLKEVHAFATDTGVPGVSYSVDFGVTWSDSGVNITDELWTIGDYSVEHGALVATNGSSVTAQFGYCFDGRNWVYSAPGAQSWEAICAFGKRVILCSLGDTNRVAYTDDLINWTNVLVSASDANAWKGIAFGDGMLFMVAATGTTTGNAAAYSVDGGDTWTLVGTGPTETGTNYRDVIFAKGAFAAVGSTGTYRSFVTDHVKEFLFKPPVEGDRVYDVAAMTHWLYQNGSWEGEFEWHIETSTTCAAGDDSTNSIIYSPVIFSAGKMLSLETSITATLQGGAGIELKQKRYDAVAFDGQKNNTPEVKSDNLTGTNGITSVNTFIISDVITFTPTGKMKVTVQHDTVGAAAITVVNWSLAIRGKWAIGVGNFC